MNTLKKTRGVGGIWRIIVIFLIGGYTLSTVLASDGYKNNLLSERENQDTENLSPLHTQLESNVAFGAKKVWNNLVNFMQDGLTPTQKGVKEIGLQEKENEKDQDSKGVMLNNPIIRTNFPESESVLLPAFEDIQNDPQRKGIETLASIGLVHGGANGKYQPKNHVRCSDFVRVMVDLYRYKQGYRLETTEGLTDQQLLTLQNPHSLLAQKLNTAKQLGLLEGVDTLVRDKTITPLQVKQILNNTFTLDPYLGQKEKLKLIDTTKSVLTKSEMAGYLAEIFQLDYQIRDSLFRDIHNHRYQEAITTLAQLGVVAGRNGNFYPDNNVLRADGVIMIANSMLANEAKALVINKFYHLNTIADVTYFATYAPHLEYLLEHEIGTSLLHHEQSGDMFLPYTLLTKGEAYSLVADASRVKVLNMDKRRNSEPITRGELAQLLVEVFDFPPKTGESGSKSPPLESGDQIPSKETVSEEKKSFLVSLLKDVVNEL